MNIFRLSRVRTSARAISILLLAASISMLMACSGTISTLNTSDGGEGSIYRLSDQLADRIMLAAMKAEIDAEKISPLVSPQQGYAGEVQWGIDVDQIVLRVRPAIGQDQIGNEVEGLVFEAEHNGTAPAAGVPTIERLLDRVAKDAAELGDRVRFVRFND
ncbi:MAG: hypothetical protein V7707_09505 [Motiliproteus sp.]